MSVLPYAATPCFQSPLYSSSPTIQCSPDQSIIINQSINSQVQLHHVRPCIARTSRSSRADQSDWLIILDINQTRHSPSISTQPLALMPTVRWVRRPLWWVDHARQAHRRGDVERQPTQCAIDVSRRSPPSKIFNLNRLIEKQTHIEMWSIQLGDFCAHANAQIADWNLIFSILATEDLFIECCQLFLVVNVGGLQFQLQLMISLIEQSINQ